MLKSRAFMVFLGFVLTTAMPALAANHYVRAGAGGNGSGSDWTNACASFTGSCASSSLVRGDTYYVAGGTYAPVDFNTPANGTIRIIIKKATVADHGTSVGWNDIYGTTVAKWFSNVLNGGDLVSFPTGYWTFDGVTGGGPSSWTTGHGFVVDTSVTTDTGIYVGGQNIIIRHVEIIGDGGDGDGTGAPNHGLYAATGTSGHTFEYMYVHDQGEIHFYIRSDNTTVQYSWAEHNESTPAQHAEGLYASRNDGILVKNLVIRYSVWKDEEGTGHTLCECDGWDVYGNIYWGVGAGGTGNGAVSGWTNKDVLNARVNNNTFVNAGNGVNFYTGGDTGQRVNITAYNNLFYNTNAAFVNVTAHDYSWFFSAGGTYGEGHPQAGTGSPFVDIVNGDFHLRAHTSTGLSLSSPFDMDADGILRVAGAWDRGAYEFGTAVTRPNPPTSVTTKVN